MAKVVLGVEGDRKSENQRLKTLNQLNVDKEIKYNTHIRTYNVINNKITEEMNLMMPINNMNRRTQMMKKLATKPRFLNKNKSTVNSYRSRAYTYNTLPSTLTKITTVKKIKMELKRHMMNTQ